MPSGLAMLDFPCKSDAAAIDIKNIHRSSAMAVQMSQRHKRASAAHQKCSPWMISPLRQDFPDW